MNKIKLPSGKSTSQIGLGCGVLVGGLGARASRKMVETALQLGITHFDVAPLYGMGLAENVIGDVIGNDSRITIATKVGLARPNYDYVKDGLRLLIRPLFRKYPLLKQNILMRGSKQPPSNTEGKSVFFFSEQAVRQSLEESLRRLQRDNVEWLLAHEPEAEALDDAARSVFDYWVAKNVIASFGVGSVKADIASYCFGSINQSSWENHLLKPAPSCMFMAHFGVIRGAPRGSDRVSALDAACAVLRAAMTQRPKDLLLVSAGTPERLRQLVGGVL